MKNISAFVLLIGLLVPRESSASAVLERVNSEYFSIASSLVATTPYTFAVWVKANDETTDHTLLGIGKSTEIYNFAILDFNGAAGGDYCRVRSRGPSPAGPVDITDGNYTANTWHLCVGVWASTTSRKAQLDSGDPTQSTSSSDPIGMNKTTLGGSPTSTLGAYCDCKVAHATIWNVALTDNEIDQLAAGANPQDIQVANIVDYWSLASDANGLNGNNWTVNSTSGTITYDADNPSVSPPAGGGASTILFRRRAQ